MEPIHPGRHHWEDLGAHILHVGQKLHHPVYMTTVKMQLREVRLVKRCRKCGKFKVKISRHRAHWPKLKVRDRQAENRVCK